MSAGPGVSDAENHWNLRPDEFRQVQQLARRTFGLDIKEGKEALVSARLNRRMRAVGLQKARQYLDFVQGDTTGQELSHLVDALTTNFTSFRREAAHFELLRTSIVEGFPRTGDIRIWSAGCSSGEEAYSILFELLETLGPEVAPRIRILASDICSKVLDQARRGVYPVAKLAEMPASWRRYLEKGSGQWTGHFRVCAAWRNLIDFRRINLMKPFGQVSKFDVIFCRNVMIYFDRPTQEDLAGRFAECLAPGGWLLIGHSEGLSGLHSGLNYIQPATYRSLGASAERRNW